ncbi:hypothetical protein WJ968_28340 [Achromobacter xylosoxidans]
MTTANAIGGGEQTFSDTSMLNASAGDAISREISTSMAAPR